MATQKQGLLPPAAVKSRVSVKMLANGQEFAGAAAGSRPRWKPLYPIRPSSAGARLPASASTSSMLLGSPRQRTIELTPFFVENFSKLEIVHCIESDNSRLSFAGLWAAKEAIAKACGIDTRPGGLSRIEIGHDDHGRPTSGFGSISISHAGELAVAICVAGHAVSSAAVGKELAGGGSSTSTEILPQPSAAPAGPRVSAASCLLCA